MVLTKYFIEDKGPVTQLVREYTKSPVRLA